MIHRSNRDIELKYRDHSSISQSGLKLLMAGVGVYNNTEPEDKYYSEKEHFIIGSGVDTLITMGADVCKEEYYVSLLEDKPTASIMSIVQEVYDLEVKVECSYLTNEHFSNESVKETILLAAENQDYQRKWKDETKYNKIILQGQDYWNDLVDSKGRQILSSQQFELIKTVSDNILNHPHTESYFQDDNDVDIYYQLPLHFTYQQVECKALLDMVIVNHRDKTIQPIDIKTMGDYVTNFPISFMRRRYDIQAAFYTQAVIDDNTGWNVFENYKVLPFKFIVESTIAPATPLVYTCDDQVMEKGKFGVLAQRVGNHVLREREGFHQAVLLYKWHMENGFELDKMVVENKGNLLLGLEGIIK